MESLVVPKTTIIWAVLLQWLKGLHRPAQEVLEQAVCGHLGFNDMLGFLSGSLISGWRFRVHNAVKNVSSLVEGAKESVCVLLSVQVETCPSHELLEFRDVGVNVHLIEFKFVKLLAGHLLVCGVCESLLEMLEEQEPHHRDVFEYWIEGIDPVTNGFCPTGDFWSFKERECERYLLNWGVIARYISVEA
jgi:hypothetical protein